MTAIATDAYVENARKKFEELSNPPEKVKQEMPQPWAGESPAEELHELVCALAAINDLMMPDDGTGGMGVVGRDEFSGLLQLLVRIQNEGSELADNYVADCYSAIADLTIPEKDLHCVNRERLASLLHVIQRMQREALARLFEAIDS